MNQDALYRAPKATSATALLAFGWGAGDTGG